MSFVKVLGVTFIDTAFCSLLCFCMSKFNFRIFLFCTMTNKYTIRNSYVCAFQIYFRITTNKMQRFLIYSFVQILYMFQAVPPPIIRSTELYIQLQVLSTNTAACCYRGCDGTAWSSISSTTAAVCKVMYS